MVMKKFTKAEIDGARKYFESKNFQKVGANLDNLKFTYFVLPQSLEPNLPDFVYRCAGELPDGYVFGISDSVREDYRQYAVAHEFIEFTKIGIDTTNRCVGALEEELNLVPENIKPGYLIMRKNFFKNLIDYCSKHQDYYTKSDLNEFKKTLDKLRRLVLKSK